MTHNTVHFESLCPICGSNYAQGFQVTVGDDVLWDIQVGEKLPWSMGKVPTGIWETEGIGVCGNCHHFIIAAVQFVGLTFAGITRVTMDPTDPDLVQKPE